MNQINDGYARVIKHRLNKQRIPKITDLEKLTSSGKVKKVELKDYVDKAKKEYDDLYKNYKEI